MDVGVSGETEALKIGYLNFNIDALYEQYLKAYDVRFLFFSLVAMRHRLIVDCFDRGFDFRCADAGLRVHKRQHNGALRHKQFKFVGASAAKSFFWLSESTVQTTVELSS